MKFCHQCGNQNPDGAKFCGHCGYKFEITENYQERKPELTQQQLVDNTYQLSQSTLNQNQPVVKKKTSALIYVILIIGISLSLCFWVSIMNSSTSSLPKNIISSNPTTTQIPTKLNINNPTPSLDRVISTSLPTKSALNYKFVKQEWFSSGDNFCNNLTRLTDIQKQKAYAEVVGTKIKWEGIVQEVNEYGVRVNPCRICFTAYLKNVPEDQAIKLNKDQMIVFDGVIIKAGKDIICDSVDVNIDTLQSKSFYTPEVSPNPG